MKGIVLAGGTGSRLFPLTKVTNKHLLPVGRYPMIYHPIARLASAGLTDILVVTGTEHVGSVIGVLGSGRQLGLELTYRVQDGAGGIAQALGLAKGFVGSDRCVVALGDNIFERDIVQYVTRFKAQKRGARVLLKKMPDPERYGVAELDGQRIVGIEEKPKNPKSSLVVTGVYMYEADVFEIIETLRPSGRGELEISDVNSTYVQRGDLEYDLLDGWWTDAGTPASLALANRLAEGVSLPVFETGADS